MFTLDPLSPPDTTVGFTGTASAPLPPPQLRGLVLVLEAARRAGATEFIHGCCIHADEQAATIASSLGMKLVGAPGRPAGDPYRSLLVNDVLLPVPAGREPELDRNRTIAARCALLVAAPRNDRMLLRSGTWATVRYVHARLYTPVVLVLPDGRVARSRAIWNPTATAVKNVEFAEILWQPVPEETAPI